MNFIETKCLKHIIIIFLYENNITKIMFPCSTGGVCMYVCVTVSVCMCVWDRISIVHNRTALYM